MNKYLIAHTLKGTAKSYCEQISSELSCKFEVADPHRRIPAHFTLKSPFKASRKQLSELNKRIHVFAENHDVGSVDLDSFGHFNRRIVYVSATAEIEAREVIDALTKTISGFEWISMGRYDHDITLHATLARLDNDSQYERIHSYLTKHYNPNTAMELDSISVLKLDAEHDEWNLHNEVQLS